MLTLLEVRREVMSRARIDILILLYIHFSGNIMALRCNTLNQDTFFSQPPKLMRQHSSRNGFKRTNALLECNEPEFCRSEISSLK